MNLQGTIICNPGEVRNINSTVPAIVGDMWSFLGGYTQLTLHSGQVPDNIPSTELAANQKPSSSNISHFWGNRCWVLEETVQRESIRTFLLRFFSPVRFSDKERHTHTQPGVLRSCFWNCKLEAGTLLIDRPQVCITFWWQRTAREARWCIGRTMRWVRNMWTRQKGNPERPLAAVEVLGAGL